MLEANITITNTSTATYVNGNLIGVSPGTTTVNVDFEPLVMGGVECYGANDTQNCYSAPVTLNPPPPATVGPGAAVSCSAATLVMGQGSGTYDTGGTCTASVDPTGGTYAWSVNTNTVTLSGTTSPVTYTAAAESKSIGDTTITLAYTDNGQTVTVPVPGLTVRDPTSLIAASDTGTELVFHCSAADGGYPCGSQRRILYQLQDALGAIGVQGIPVAESFTPGSDACGVATNVPNATKTATESDGDFASADTLALCSTACSTGACPVTGSCALTVTQTIEANGISVRTNALDYGCTNITVNRQ
ncbi:MAG: hypothetical protein ACRDN0_10900 [Trebonia sp.]